MKPTDKNTDCDVAKYFQNLGYQYSWDFDKTLRWHEIFKDNSMVLQVEMGIPLDIIIKDMATIEEVDNTYFVATPNFNSYVEICNKVREFESNKLPF